MSEVKVEVTCAMCGVQRDSELAYSGEHPPCPNCGEIDQAWRITLGDTINTPTDSMSGSMIPVNQERSWEKRWDGIQSSLQRHQATHMEPLSAESISVARHALHGFFVETYSIKDSLTHEGMKGVEAAITADPRLSLLADLANSEKHPAHKNPARSGEYPTILGTFGDFGNDPGWRLSLKIKHKGVVLDGLTVAEQAVAAWLEFLHKQGQIT